MTIEKEVTLFQRLKDFINQRHSVAGWFTTQQMRNAIGRYEYLSFWKKYNNNPNYVLHQYIGCLHELGCITRVKRGHYKINGSIPEWFGSYHFNGLKGNLDHPNNLYWNGLPAHYRVNPWAKAKMSASIDTAIADALELKREDNTNEITDVTEVEVRKTYFVEAQDKTYTVLMYTDDTSHRWFDIYDDAGNEVYRSHKVYDALISAVEFCEQKQIFA